MPPRSRRLPAAADRAVHFSADSALPQGVADLFVLENIYTSLQSAPPAVASFNASAAAAADVFFSEHPFGSTHFPPVSPNPFLSPAEMRGDFSETFLLAPTLAGSHLDAAASAARSPQPLPPQDLQVPLDSGLFPAESEANSLRDISATGLSPASAIAGQTLLDGGAFTGARIPLRAPGLSPTSAHEIANESAATMPSMPASSYARDSSSLSRSTSLCNVHLQTLDASHTFDIVFADLPSLAWLRPAWINADLNGRLLYRLQPPHLADVLVDMELASQRYITSRHQKLNISRAIFSLIVADVTSDPANIAAWDRYSLVLPPINNILSVNCTKYRIRPLAF